MPVANYDMAPTAVYALNKKRPIQWRGRPVLEAFERNELIQSPSFPGLPPRDEPVLHTDLFKPWVGWYYTETLMDEETTQCLARYRLNFTYLWGQWDLASFLVGLAVGISAMIVLVLMWFLIWSFCRHRRLGYRPVQN
jgi:hypothetical protein